MPHVWPSVSILGKATWFTVLADLGRVDQTGMPNMLADADLLANLSQNMTTVNKTLEGSGPGRFRRGLVAGLSTKSFDPSQPAGISLGISPAVLAMNYMCQVPQPKTAGTLFFSILVADLVLLQALHVVGIPIRRRHFLDCKKAAVEKMRGLYAWSGRHHPTTCAG